MAGVFFPLALFTDIARPSPLPLFSVPADEKHERTPRSTLVPHFAYCALIVRLFRLLLIPNGLG
jgi:hypothetical protein